MDWISSESLPGLPRESEAFMVLFCLFVCLFFLVFVFVAFLFGKTEGKKNTSTCVQCTKKMVEGFVRSRSQEHNWYYTCNLALQSVHTSLVRSWCFSCSPIPVSVSLFAFNVVIVSSRYVQMRTLLLFSFIVDSHIRSFRWFISWSVFMAVNSHNEIFNTPFLPNNFIVEFRRCIFVILLLNSRV